MITIGSALRQLRLAAGMSQRALAGELGVSKTYISHLEANRREPSLRALKQIAATLAVPTGLLLAIAISVDLDAEDRALYGGILERLIQLSMPPQSERESRLA